MLNKLYYHVVAVKLSTVSVI